MHPEARIQPNLQTNQWDFIFLTFENKKHSLVKAKINDSANKQSGPIALRAKEIFESEIHGTGRSDQIRHLVVQIDDPDRGEVAIRILQQLESAEIGVRQIITGGSKTLEVRGGPKRQGF